MPTITEIPDPPAPAPSPGPSGAGGAGGDAAKDKNENWRFLEPQPVREDQVENAVKFLSHPKVRGSPVVYRRSFLERKGLSREEIDEAFRRVPDPPSETAASVPATGNASMPQQRVQPGTAQVVPKSRSWTQMLLALGVLSAAGAGAGVFSKKYLIPKLREWILEVVSGKGKHEQPSKPSPVEEATSAAAAAASAAASAASQMAVAMQEISKYRSEDRQRLENLIRAIDSQTQELKDTLAGMKDTVQNAEVTKYQRSVNFQVNAGQSKGVRSTETRASSVVKPTNFGSEPGPSTSFFGNGQQTAFPKNTLSPSSSNGNIHAPHSQSYLDVMAMLERGEKPPGIREINDKPPNPSQPPSNPRLQPRPKPWEKHTDETHPTSSVIGVDPEQLGRFDEDWSNDSSRSPQAGAGVTSLEPWWRRKMDAGDGYNSSSVKITEIDPTAEVDIGTVPERQSSSASFSGQSGGGRPGWVPPAVPQTIYPGAEEAIRRVKPTSAEGTPARNLGSSSGSAVSTGIPSQVNDASASEAPMSSPIEVDTQERAEVPDEQERDYIETSLVDPNRSFKDVVQEGDD